MIYRVTGHQIGHPERAWAIGQDLTYQGACQLMTRLHGQCPWLAEGDIYMTVEPVTWALPQDRAAEAVGAR